MTSKNIVSFMCLVFCVSALSSCAGKFRKEIKYNSYNSKPFVDYLLNRAVKIKVVYSCADRSTGQVSQKKSGGSGIIIYSSKKGFSYVLTAEHVVEDESNSTRICRISSLTVMRYTHGNKLVGSYKARVVSGDNKVDLALLKIRKNLGVSTKLARTEYIGQSVHSLGFPVVLAHWRGVYPVYSGGNISAVKIKVGDRECTEFTAKIFYGNSGGGIYTNRGELISVSTMFYWYGGRHTTYYGPSLGSIKKFLKKSKFYYKI